MDESRRLRPMVAYDQKLFNQIYKETRALRNKLAWDIDARKFGVDYDEIKSWFDIKFIFTFNKYYGNPRLKGYIISSLQTYKQRIIKNSYLKHNQIHKTTDITELYNYEELIIEEPESGSENYLLLKAKEYLKARLSYEASLVLDIDLNPPPYILERLSKEGHKKIPKCPAALVAEYLGIDDPNEVEALRREIKSMVKQAQTYFSIVKV